MFHKHLYTLTAGVPGYNVFIFIYGRMGSNPAVTVL